MSASRRFLDSNVILYLMSSDDRKAGISGQLLQDGGVISLQVLNETASVLLKKSEKSADFVQKFLADILNLVEVVPLTHEITNTALHLVKSYRFSFYDSLIVAAAAQAGCDQLMTEDLKHGQKLGSLTVFKSWLGLFEQFRG